MKAMVLEKQAPINQNPLEERDMPTLEPGPGEILVKVSACGVCHTDLHIVEGDFPLERVPVIPGHQIVGTVEDAGKGAARFKSGERVGVAWLHSTCGKCRFCCSERENLCPNASFTGFHHHGGFSETMIVPEEFAYSLPEGFSDLQAAPLLCAGIIGYRALRLSGIQPGGRLGLYGFGASAHVTIQIAGYLGCDVYAFSRGGAHRKLAEKLGAVWTGKVPEVPPEKLDASIIFAPAGDLVPPALEALESGGTLALAGIHMSNVPELEYSRHLYYERTIKSVTANTRSDGRELLALAGEIPIVTNVTPYPLSEANQVLAMLKSGGIDGAAVLVP